MSTGSWLSSLLMSPDTCGTSWQPFLVSLSPAACALLSATALWVARRAAGTSRDAQLTSLETQLLSQLAIGSQLAMGDPGAHQAQPKHSSTTAGPESTYTSPGDP